MRGIIAVVPIFIKGRGICTQIFYEDKTVIDDRSCEHFLKNMCDDKNISKRIMKKNVKELIQIRRNIPWVIDHNTVFFAVTTKKSDFKELRRAFINCNYVQKIDGHEVVLITGERITTLQNEESLRISLTAANYLIYRMKYETLKSFIIGDGIGLKAKTLEASTGERLF